MVKIITELTVNKLYIEGYFYTLLPISDAFVINLVDSDLKIINKIKQLAEQAQIVCKIIPHASLLPKDQKLQNKNKTHQLAHRICQEQKWSKTETFYFDFGWTVPQIREFKKQFLQDYAYVLVHRKRGYARDFHARFIRLDLEWEWVCGGYSIYFEGKKKVTISNREIFLLPTEKLAKQLRVNKQKRNKVKKTLNGCYPKVLTELILSYLNPQHDFVK